MVKSWRFGDTKKEADDLVRLVISGKKKATSSLTIPTNARNMPCQRWETGVS